MRVSRKQVLAYRVRAQGLERGSTSLGRLRVLDLGIQDSGADSARLAFDARLAAPPPADAIGPGRPLALTWSLRGAPYVHRRRDLDRVAAALWPLSEADAAGRLNETGPSIARAGIPAMEQYRLAVEAMHAVVTKPMSKGAASGAVTRKIPAAMRRNCRACKTSHISDSAMRPAALSAGLEIEPGSSPPVLLPRPGARRIEDVDVAATRRLITAYLRFLGPASTADVAGYLDARRADVEDIWPTGLVEIDVEGQARWLPADCVDDLRGAKPIELVRLLGPFDPYLQARDRNLLVPDHRVHKALWPVLGRPGVVLVDGEVVGTWRTRNSGKKLTVTVEEFASLPPSVRSQIDAEAERVAAVRGASSVTVK